MIARSLLIAAALLAASMTSAAAQSRSETIAVPTLRASITVADDIVRVGDLIDTIRTGGVDAAVADALAASHTPESNDLQQRSAR